MLFLTGVWTLYSSGWLLSHSMMHDQLCFNVNMLTLLVQLAVLHTSAFNNSVYFLVIFCVLAFSDSSCC